MNTFLEVLKALLVGWIKGLLAFIKVISALCHRKKKPKQTPACGCASVSTTTYKRPDPTIYDQYYLMNLGYAVTWQNPDIHIYPAGTSGNMYSWPAGIPLSPEQLLPGTQYVVVSRIWNKSLVAAALGIEINLSYLSFGAGAASHPIPDPPVVLNVGVLGDTQHCPAYAYMKWTTPSTPGHYCLQTTITCNDDLDPGNNLGQLNTQVVAAASPANFSFTLGNPDKTKHSYHFKYDSYVIPPLGPCENGGKRESPKQQQARALARNNVANFPLPPGWQISFNPAENTLGPGEEKQVHVTITPPDSFTGKQPVNIHAFTEKNDLLGGITVYITK